MEKAEIIVAGFPGYDAGKIVTLFDEQVAPLSADVIILMVGTNDALNSWCNAFSAYEYNLRTLVEKARSASHNVILCTILPFDEAELLLRHDVKAYGQAGPQGRLESVNAIIRQVAKETGVICVDVNSEFVKAEWRNAGLIRMNDNCGESDGVHPTPKGYELLADCLYRAILANGLTKCKIVCLGDSITYGVHVDGEGTTTGQTYPAVLRRKLEKECHE